MRVVPVVAAFTACVVCSGVGAYSDDPAPPPPSFLLWNRPEAWETKTDEDSPVQIDSIGWAQTDDGIVVGAYRAVGTSSDRSFIGNATASGLGVAGGASFDIGGGPTGVQGHFALKITDTERYEKFKGKFSVLGKRLFSFKGTYERGDPAREEGAADLRLLLFATKPAHHLGKKPITAILRKDLPAKIAFVAVVQNTGPALLPYGVGRMKFTVTPSIGVTLPLVWKLERVEAPNPTYGPGDVAGQSWVEYVKMGALGQKKDRSSYAIEADLGAAIPSDVKSLHVRFEVESIAPEFKITNKDVKSDNSHADVDIPILDDNGV